MREYGILLNADGRNRLLLLVSGQRPKKRQPLLIVKPWTLFLMLFLWRNSWEGTKVVKINKLQQLPTRFESIRMSDDESLNEFYAKLNDIINFAYNLGEIYDQPKIVMKILRSLIEDFRLKVTITTESKDVDSILVDKLVKSLQSYELDYPKQTNPNQWLLSQLIMLMTMDLIIVKDIFLYNWHILWQYALYLYLDKSKMVQDDHYKWLNWRHEDYSRNT